MEGIDDGHDGSDSSIPTSTENENSGSTDLDKSGSSNERSDLADGKQSNSSDPGNTSGGERTSGEDEGNHSREIAREASLEAIEMLVSSGPIADAESFYQYKPEHQERLIRMAEAPRTDESRRRDHMVEAQTSLIKRAQWIQTLMLGSCIGLAAVSFWVFSQPWGGFFLTLPVMQAVGTMMKPGK